MNGQMIDDSSDSPRPETVTNTLTLERLTRGHLHAVLGCRASNSNHTAPLHTSITIEMNFQPLSVKILASREAISAGKEYELVCQSVGARPPASITWWLDGAHLTNATISTASNGNVTLSKLHLVPSDTDRGKFLKCLAESPVINHQPLHDQWKLDVQYTPQVYLAMGSSLTPSEIKEGDDVYFECNVKAHPYVYKVVWYHNGVQVQHNVSVGVIVSNQSLVIQRIRRQHSGLYTCVASNIEGDGQSNAVFLKVQYAPVCASGQVHVYGAARNEEVSITCRLDAVPSNVHFFWRFNSSGDVVDIAENHVATQGLQSSLSYVARTELDYGTLLCWGTNALGKQRKPCAYKVVAAGKPNPPEKCNLTNHTTENLIVHCLPGYDGGLQQKFIIEAYEAESKRLLLNITENTAPSFSLRGLQSGTTYVMHVYAANDRGPSEKRYLTGYTIKDVAERRTAQVRPPPEELVSITPILEVVVGVVGSLVLVALVAVVVLSFKKKRRSRRKTVTLTLQKSLTNTRDLDDKNPDLIPANGHGESENKSPTTPEEGGFGSVHICASVPYPSNVYNTYPRSPRPMLQASSQNAELMYAELCFPRGTSHYATGTFTRHKADPTIYAQIDHAMPGTPVSRGLVPLSSGSKGANVVPLSSGNIGATVVPLSSGNIGATIATLSSGLMGSTMAEAVASNMGGIVGGNMGDSILEMGVSICPGSSMVMCAQEVESGNLQHHNTPTQPAHAFTPSILQEEDEVTADTSLVNDHKESEV